MNLQNKIVDIPDYNVCFDYLTCSFPMVVRADCESEYIGWLQQFREKVVKLMGFVEYEMVDMGFGCGFYERLYSIGENITFKFKGPKDVNGHYTSCLELKGKGCREFELRNGDVISWYYFFEYIFEKWDAKFSRVDIAIDDFKGKFCDIKKIYNKVLLNQYVSPFRKCPVYMFQQEFGESLTFGSHGSNLEFQIYDKLKERKNVDELSFNLKCWFRYEMRFNRLKANELILNILGYSNVLDEEKQIKTIKIDTSLLKKGMENYSNEFVNLSKGLLYNLLDIKVSNNDDANHQSRHKTIKWWSDFLGDVGKIPITNQGKLESSLVKKKKWNLENISRQELAIYLGSNEFPDSLDCFDDFTLEKFLYASTKWRKRDFALIHSAREFKGLSVLTMDDFKEFAEKIRKERRLENEN